MNPFRLFLYFRKSNSNLQALTVLADNVVSIDVSSTAFDSSGAADDTVNVRVNKSSYPDASLAVGAGAVLIKLSTEAGKAYDVACAIAEACVAREGVFTVADDVTGDRMDGISSVSTINLLT